MNFKILALALTASAAMPFAIGSAQAGPMSLAPSAISGAPNPLLQDVQVVVRIYHGRRYCFYPAGWHGPGWYRCGWAWREGYGWGGVIGWNDWDVGPRYRHHHHHGRYYGERHDRGGGKYIAGPYNRHSFGGKLGTTGQGPRIQGGGGGGSNFHPAPSAGGGGPAGGGPGDGGGNIMGGGKGGH